MHCRIYCLTTRNSFLLYCLLCLYKIYFVCMWYQRIRIIREMWIIITFANICFHWDSSLNDGIELMPSAWRNFDWWTSQNMRKLKYPSRFEELSPLHTWTDVASKTHKGYALQSMYFLWYYIYRIQYFKELLPQPRKKWKSRNGNI